jgi:hypothetical protein
VEDEQLRTKLRLVISNTAKRLGCRWGVNSKTGRRAIVCKAVVQDSSGYGQG